MKMIKKILAGACALAMAMSAIASLTVTASAAEVPTAYTAVTVDENAKTATVELRVKNIPTVLDDGFDDPAYITALGLQLDVSSYSTASIAGMSGRNFTAWKKSYFTDGKLAMGALVSNANPGYLSYGTAYTSLNAITANGATPAELTIFTVHDLPLSDDAIANGFSVEIKDFQLVLNNEYWGTSDAFEVLYKSANSTAAVEKATWTPSAPPVTETIPTATEATPVYDGTPANWQGTAATAIGGTYNGVMEGDTAVAYGVGLKGDGNAHTKVIWKVTAKGETKGHEMALDFGGEGTAKVGLAIQGLTAEDNADVSVAFGD